MAQHHLDDLWQSLIQKGWTIEATRSLDDHPYDCHAWIIERGASRFEIQFDRFDGIGNDVSLDESSGCSILHHNNVSLYFGKQPKWTKELASFVGALDALGS